MEHGKLIGSLIHYTSTLVSTKYCPNLNFSKLFRVSKLLLNLFGYSTASSFTEAEAVEDFFTEQNFGNYERGTPNTPETSSFTLPSALLNAPPDPLPRHYFSTNKKFVSDISFADPDTSLANRKEV